jgi:hypothetical protein
VLFKGHDSLSVGQIMDAYSGGFPCGSWTREDASDPLGPLYNKSNGWVRLCRRCCVERGLMW